LKDAMKKARPKALGPEDKSQKGDNPEVKSIGPLDYIK